MPVGLGIAVGSPGKKAEANETGMSWPLVTARHSTPWRCFGERGDTAMNRQLNPQRYISQLFP
jgi:hypothetical protein